MKKNQDLLFVFYSLSCIFLFSFWIKKIRIQVEQNLNKENIEKINTLIVIWNFFYIIFWISIFFWFLYNIFEYNLFQIIYFTFFSFGISLIIYFTYNITNWKNIKQINEIKIDRRYNYLKKMYFDFLIVFWKFKKVCYSLMSKIF